MHASEADIPERSEEQEFAVAQVHAGQQILSDRASGNWLLDRGVDVQLFRILGE